MGAQAKFALFVASLLERAGVATLGEFSSLLRTFADSVAETEPEEAAILDQWADNLDRTVSN